MSSEGSVSTSSSSRIRQFGLYRTIDARTEEFLRLSRKRQIKQGCACAAVSTAITVTVVITVFLVYMEYGMNTDTNQQSLGKAGWIGLLNDSLASSFEEKFSKSKINFDRNTIKLLPILIKALKQNRYLEKIIEDYSSSSPAYDGKVTTEFSFKKDIFLNTKRWIKKPTSRLYTIEYKTSPIVFVKNPTKEPGYFTKNRKIRDYKRIMDYVEKMISDKVGFGSTIPMTNKRLEDQTEMIQQHLQVTSKPMQEFKINKKYKSSKKKSSKNKVTKPKQDDIVSCKCPKQLSLLLDKIFTSIQQLIPDDKLSRPVPCSEDQKTNAQEPNPDIAFYPPKLLSTSTSSTLTNITKSLTETKQQSIPVQFSEFDNIFHKEETTIIPKETSRQPVRLKYLSNLKMFEANRQENTNVFNNKDTTVPTIDLSAQTSRLPFLENKNVFQENESIISPSFWGIRLANSDIQVQTTTVYDHIEPTEAYFDTTITTQPMTSTIDISKIKHNVNTTTEKYLQLESEERNTATSESIQSDKTLQNLNLNTDTMSHKNIMLLTSKKKDHITTPTTTVNVLDEMNKFNIRSFELLKSKLIPPNKRPNPTVKYPVSSIMEHEYSTTESSNEYSTTTLSTDNLIKSMPPYLYRYGPKIITNEEREEKNRISKSNVEYKVVAPSIRIKENATSRNTENGTLEIDKNKQEPFYLKMENTALEEEIEKMTRDEEYQEELNMKQIKSGNQIIKSGHFKNSTNKLQDTTETDFWNILKNNERFLESNSMIPHNRPTYLEIHRSDWKQEENKDYDDDMKYNIFDLL